MVIFHSKMLVYQRVSPDITCQGMLCWVLNKLPTPPSPPTSILWSGIKCAISTHSQCHAQTARFSSSTRRRPTRTARCAHRTRGDARGVPCNGTGQVDTSRDVSEMDPKQIQVLDVLPEQRRNAQVPPVNGRKRRLQKYCTTCQTACQTAACAWSQSEELFICKAHQSQDSKKIYLNSIN